MKLVGIICFQEVSNLSNSNVKMSNYVKLNALLD